MQYILEPFNHSEMDLIKWLFIIFKHIYKNLYTFLLYNCYIGE